MSHEYLPKLITGVSGAGNLSSGQSGIWHSPLPGPKALKSIQAGIEITAATVSKRGISSVPSVWARPIIFQTLLSDKEHPLHDQTMDEWRGLMSLLALRNVYTECRVEFQYLDMPSLQTKSSVLYHALDKLAPDALRFGPTQTYRFTDVLLIKLEGVCVGAFSPYTLVYTGANYAEKLKGKDSVKYCKFVDENGRLREPRDETINGEVKEWLTRHVREFLRQLGRSADDTSKACLANWIKWINEWVGGDDFENVDVDTVDPSDRMDLAGAEVPFLREGTDEYTIYQNLLTPLKKAAGGGDRLNKCECLLEFPQLELASQRKVLVINEEILRGDCRLRDDLKPSKLPEGKDAKEWLSIYFGGTRGKVLAKTPLPEGAEWIRPDLLFFTEELFRSDTADKLLGETLHGLPGNGHYLLPFTPALLEFFDLSDAQEWSKLNPALTVDGDSVSVSISLRIRHRAEPLVIRKTYGSTQVRTLESSLVSLFPEYPHPAWKAYYLFQYLPDGIEVEPAYCRTPASVLGTMPLNAECKALQLKYTPQIKTIFGEGAYPNALVFKNTLTSPATVVGLLPVFKLSHHAGDVESGRSEEISFGVDFGTSNTNIWRKTTEVKATKWNIELDKSNRLFVSNLQEKQRDRLLKHLFVPSSRTTLPTPTALRKGLTATDKRSLVVDYFPYFANNDIVLPGNVKANLKWDTSDTAKEDMKGFFEGILFLILLDCVYNGSTKLRILFTYPKNYNQNQLVQLRDSWQRAGKLIFGGAFVGLSSSDGATNAYALRVNDEKQGVPPSFQAVRDFVTEGQSAGIYFEKAGDSKAVSRRQGFVGIDIGGGTTDVSIWGSSKGSERIIYDTSIALAGREVTALFQKNPKLREAMFRDKDVVAILERFQDRETVFPQLLNILLSRLEQDKKIAGMLQYSANDPQMHWLRRMLCLEFGAVAYYCGTAVAAFKDDVGLVNVQKGYVALILGGNGSKFLSWIDLGGAWHTGRAGDILKVFYQNALSVSSIKLQTAGIYATLEPKSEASGGLVLMNPDVDEKLFHPPKKSDPTDLILGVDDDNDSTLSDPDYGNVTAGDEITLNNGSLLGAEQILTDKLLYQDGQCLIQDLSCKRLIHFVKILNLAGVKMGIFRPETQLDFTADLKSQVERRVLAHYAHQGRLPPNARSLEPVFLVQIRELMEIVGING